MIPSLPRGRYAFESSVAVVEDPFGLERTEVPLETSGALLVYPRLVELEQLSSETGANAGDGRRLLLRRPSGFDLHRVREYESGESLRKVHWPTTARRGQLMVKELEDEDREEIAVVLDVPGGRAAPPALRQSFDAQVRAAGSILRAHVRAGRPSALVVNTLEPERRAIRSPERDWRPVLELLAAIVPAPSSPVAGVLREGGAAGRALEFAVVTALVAPDLVERLLERARRRRRASLVYVDAGTFAGRAPSREPGLLRLQAAGIPVAVVRRGDDLAAALGAQARAQARKAAAR